MHDVRGRGVQSIEVGGRLLQALVAATGPMMLRDLAQASGMGPAQAHSYLVSFRRLGLVEQDESDRYRLGPFALTLGIARMRITDALRLAIAKLPVLSETTGMMTMVVVMGTRGPTVIAAEEAARQLHVSVRPGTLYSMIGTASGRVFSAWLPEAVAVRHIAAERAEGPSQYLVGTLLDEAELDRLLAEARARGYSATEGVPIPGVNAISAPVFDASGRIALALTVIGPEGGLDTGPHSPQVAALLAHCAELSAQLGYMPEAAGNSTIEREVQE
ncbi:MAG: IclR family transcriptional regulator [Pararhodobacter sp.]|nr:IclR family transcriptional regulator [Pararhodobacter sp.]